VPGAPAVLVPHRAVYELTLDKSRAASGISGVSGRMVFEFAGSGCDGYTMNMRLVTRVEGSSGRSIMTDLRSSTWEQGTGTRYRFHSSHYKGEALEEATSGDAERSVADGDVNVHVNAPSPKNIKVSARGIMGDMRCAHSHFDNGINSSELKSPLMAKSP